jgi:hypothetical protein
MGGILLILILYKYVKTRRLVAGYSISGGWWASGSKDSRGTRDLSQQATVESEVTFNTRSSIYDRALLVRFSIGFVILACVLSLFGNDLTVTDSWKRLRSCHYSVHLVSVQQQRPDSCFRRPRLQRFQHHFRYRALHPWGNRLIGRLLGFWYN